MSLAYWGSKVQGSIEHLRLRLWGLWESRGLGSRVLGLGFRVLGLGFRASGLGSWVSGFEFRVSGLGFRVSGFQGPDFGFRV